MSSFSDRRRFLKSIAGGAAALAAASCAPAAAPPAAPATAGSGATVWQEQWEKMVQAAKSEGVVVIDSRPGAGYRATYNAFEEAFPGIKVEPTNMASNSLWVTRVIQEAQQGLHSWDIELSPLDATMQQLNTVGGYAPIRPLLVLPEVVDDAAWAGGFDASFMDNERRQVFGYESNLSGQIYINTDLVKESEIQSVKDLLNPRWKGQITSDDPRFAGIYWAMYFIWQHFGDTQGREFLKQLWVDQKTVISRDRRQLAEGVVRGNYAMTWGPALDPILDEFKKQGVGNNIKMVFLPESRHTSIRSAFLLNNAPHPNAAAVFLNWFLSKAGQSIYNKQLPGNSRRKDVEPGQPITYPDPNQKYRGYGTEASVPWAEQIQKLMTDILGS